MALTFKEARQLFQVPTRGRVRLNDYEPGWAADKQFKDLTKDELKARAAEFLERNIADLAAIITRLIDGLGVKFPKVSDKDQRRLAVGKRELSVRK